ncbi:MAG: fimbrillin family protein [Rikenellaceae bacterium]
MKKLIYTALSLLIFASCDMDDGTNPNTESGELQITSSIATRASGTSWAEGDEIGVSMYTTTTTTTAYGAENTLYTTATSSGYFASTTPLYFPAAEDVDLLAYYPYVTPVDLGAYELSVGGTQTESKIDLMKTTATEVQSTSEAVNMTFYHMLSKLQITIADSETVSASELVDGTMTLSGAVTEGSYNLHTDDVTLSAASDDIVATISAAGVAEMILIPQTLTDALLTFETEAGVTYTATLSATFGSGDQTSYTASMSLTEANLSGAVIGDWGEGNGVDGEELGVGVFTPDIELVDGVYNVYTAAGLFEFASMVNSGDTSFDCTLMGDVDLEGVEWTPIGDYYNHQYSGTFDGGGYLVSGLSITGSSCIGLFGCIDSSAEVSNIGVSGSVSGESEFGGVVGLNFGTLTNCYNMASVSGEACVGGVVGANCDGTLTNCYNMGDVDGDMAYIGGVVGQNLGGGTLTNCYNTGSVSGSDSGVCFGGVVGCNEGGTLTNCYNMGDVDGGMEVGGVVGKNLGTLTNCYNTASVSSSDIGGNVGGVVGNNDGTLTICYNSGSVIGEWQVGGVTGCNSGTLTNCYWDNEKSGVSYDIGYDNNSQTTTPMSTSAMQEDSFVTTLNNNAATYNTENLDATQACAWVAVEDDYPTLDFDGTPTKTFD